MIQAYKYVFTSPSSVDKEPKATRSGNARIHGMTQVTLPSIAYIATQVSTSIIACVIKSLVIERVAGSICAMFIPGIFEDRHYHGLGNIL